jgi:predicted GNAT family acetyltransferase
MVGRVRRVLADGFTSGEVVALVLGWALVAALAVWVAAALADDLAASLPPAALARDAVAALCYVAVLAASLIVAHTMVEVWRGGRGMHR